MLYTAFSSEENAELLSVSVGEASSGAASAEDSERSGAASAESGHVAAELPDGTYMAEFQTDSSMFRVNETCDGKGILKVENGEMTIHISLGSKKIINLYPGLAENAAKDGAELLQPTTDLVTYSDGMTEEVYGFDVPVPGLDSEFDLELIGTKGVWYDHKVSVSDPVLSEETQANAADGQESLQSEGTGGQTDAQTGNADIPADGTYSMEITFEGGSGKAEILSPVTVTVTDGKAVATVQWNSPNYDYMIVDGEKYLPVNTDGEIPCLKSRSRALMNLWTLLAIPWR